MRNLGYGVITGLVVFACGGRSTGVDETLLSADSCNIDVSDGWGTGGGSSNELGNGGRLVSASGAGASLIAGALSLGGTAAAGALPGANGGTTTANGGTTTANGGLNAANGGNAMANGGVNAANGGNATANGGTTTANGGVNAANGGIATANGGTTTANGGVNAANGGNAMANGGANAANGGVNAANGGVNAANGGTTTANGGTAMANGGVNAANGGVNAATGGTTTANGGNAMANGGVNAANGGTTELIGGMTSTGGTAGSGSSPAIIGSWIGCHCGESNCGTCPLSPTVSRVGYRIDAFETTNIEYAAFLAANPPIDGQPTICNWNWTFVPAGDWPATGRPTQPVTWIDWCDAYAYCAWAGKRLCGARNGGAAPFTSNDDAARNEWFAACTDEGAHAYPYGNEFLPTACNGAERGIGLWTNVGSLPECQVIGTGIYDMSGNVYEWENSCSTWEGGQDVCHARGGSFYTEDPNLLRCRTASTIYTRSATRKNIAFGAAMTHKRALLLASFMLACSGQPQGEDDTRLRVTLRLMDESGTVVSNGWIDCRNARMETNDRGEVDLSLNGPDVVIAGGPDQLPEPVVLGTRDQRTTVSVRLWSSNSGARRAIHFGGDVMFARRYLEPTSGNPLLSSGQLAADAVHVVQHIAEPFGAADVSIVNLETVVSNLGPDRAYPGKRFLLNSPPEALAGLEAMGVDVVGLANNHTRDWLDAGLQETLAALDSFGIPHVGAGSDDATARKTAFTDVHGGRIATLAYTSVNGSFVNDNYPDDTAPMPTTVVEDDEWIWERRPFACDLPGFSIEAGTYRIGAVWRRFAAAEDSMSEQERASAWSTLTAVYPELQDWVARRGHGGAAYYVSSRMKTDVAQARLDASLVAVMLHAGYQFQDVPSETVTDMAHAAIDAGADIVVCHHPHVLQGAEYYRGKFIFYSLGNFVFDQDFLSTFSTAFLRTVWDGGTLLEARIVPVEIASYRPTPVTDQAAERVFERIWESSLSSAKSSRVSERVIPLQSSTVDSAAALSLVREWGTARFGNQFSMHASSLSASQTVVELEPNRLARVVDGQAATALQAWSLGRDLLGWGHFEDVLADGLRSFGQNYVDDHEDKAILTGDATLGGAFLRLKRNYKKKDSLYMRPVARIALPRHRVYALPQSEVIPSDPEPTYSIRAKVRGRGDVRASFRIDCFHFDDTNPTEDPSSQLLASIQVPVGAVTGSFVGVEFPVALKPDDAGIVANMVMLYVGLAPPAEGDAEFDVDEIKWVEWRKPNSAKNDFGAFEYVRSEGAAPPLNIEWVSM